MTSMKQVTLRLDEALVTRVKAAASARGESVNAFAESVLSAAVDPETAHSPIQRMRERLARAGILAEFEPYTGPVPTQEELDEAGREAGKGKPVSEILLEQRGPR